MPSAFASPIPLPGRLRALGMRERIFVAAAILSLLLFLVWVLSGGSAPAPAASLPSPAPSVPAVRAPSPSSAPAPAVPAADVSGLVLNGIMGKGAIITFPDGAQRGVPLGREFLPGLTLKALGLSHVLVGSAGGDFRLDLNRFGAAAVPAAAVPAGAGQPAPARTLAPAEREWNGRTTDYRLGLEPVAANGRTAGHRIKPGAALPGLEQAGLRAGDTIVAINGSTFDEERLLELSWQLANSTRTEVEFLRGGRRVKAVIGAK